jgi:hypothetical protein
MAWIPASASASLCRAIVGRQDVQARHLPVPVSEAPRHALRIHVGDEHAAGAAAGGERRPVALDERHLARGARDQDARRLRRRLSARLAPGPESALVFDHPRDARLQRGRGSPAGDRAKAGHVSLMGLEGDLRTHPLVAESGEVHFERAQQLRHASRLAAAEIHDSDGIAHSQAQQPLGHVVGVDVVEHALDAIGRERGVLVAYELPYPAGYDVAGALSVDAEDARRDAAERRRLEMREELQLDLVEELGRSAEIPRLYRGRLPKNDRAPAGHVEGVGRGIVDEVARSEDRTPDAGRTLKQRSDVMAECRVVAKVLRPESLRLDAAFEGCGEVETDLGREAVHLL